MSQADAAAAKETIKEDVKNKEKLIKDSREADLLNTIAMQRAKGILSPAAITKKMLLSPTIKIEPNIKVESSTSPMPHMKMEHNISPMQPYMQLDQEDVKVSV